MGTLKRIHYWLGLLGILAFLLTGQYMHHAYSHLQGMADGPRMLFRSAHIYLLFTAVTNLLLGVYMQPKSLGHGKAVQIVVSVLVLLDPLFVLAGFFVEPQLAHLTRPYSRLGVYGVFAATVLLALTDAMKGVRQRKEHEAG